MKDKARDPSPTTLFQTLNLKQNIYRQMFEHSVIPILIHDLEMNIHDANEKALEQFGYSREELLRKKVYDLHPEETLQQSEEVRKQMETTDKLSVEGLFKRKDGSIFIAEATPTRYLLEGKALIHVYINDISQRKDDELKILNAMKKAEESDRLKTIFLENISHEIRTPLTGIMGYSSMLQKYELPSKKIKEVAARIGKSGEYLLDMINNILDLSTIEAGQMVISKAPVDLHNLLRELYDIFDSRIRSDDGKDLQLKVSIPEDEFIIITDQTRLRQILINLIDNAIKYTQKGEITFGYEQEEEKLKFYVKDTGMGIPEADRDKIFDRFHQTTTALELFKGTGLGLNIAKACTELLKGEIWLTSELGEGTTFYFTIEYLPA